MPCAVPLARPSDEAMSDRPSRRSPPASSRSMAAARSSDWMFRAIADRPSVALFDNAEHYRLMSTCASLSGGHRAYARHRRSPDAAPTHVRPVDAATVGAPPGYPGRVRLSTPDGAKPTAVASQGAPSMASSPTHPFRRQPDPGRRPP